MPKMKPRKIPLRRCTGCMMMLNKNSLIRVVKTKSGEFSLDFSGKKSGRGAYICPDLSCFNLAKKQRGLEKSFKEQVPVTVYEKLSDELNKNGS